MAVPSTNAPPAETNAEVPIPQPPPTFLLGNLPDIDPSAPIRRFADLAKVYGPIYQMQLKRRTIIITSQKLVHEACDQTRFHKDPSPTQMEVRALTGDGLFTAVHQEGNMHVEPNWWKAHRLLIPAFGPLGIRGMFDMMLDISSQQVLRWDRLGPNHGIDCSDDFTRLAFDTIGLCAFGYRFNEFYSDDAHPFATQMANVLKISGRRANRSQAENYLHRWEEQSRQADVKKMHDLTHEIVADRKANPQPESKDLLNTMLYGVDRETGEGLSVQNIVYNMVTFLVAGHETTSGTLSFMWYNLTRHPDAFHAAQKQVDEVVGDNVITPDMLPKLTYIDACIKETLRLNSPIGVLAVVPNEDTLLGGKYKVYKHDQISMILAGLHHDPAVWGEDHNEFKPERFLNGGFQALPPDSWKPFGNGLRACIGRAFAEQEMVMNTALLLQRFIPEAADPTYTLHIKTNLTLKPDGFKIKMRRRPGKSPLVGIPGGVLKTAQEKHAGHPSAQQGTTSTPSSSALKVNIFFGGNSGTCEGFAQSLQNKLTERGVQASLASLDSAAQHLSKDQVSVIITASYEGLPPDNAKQFVSWLEGVKDTSALNGVKYAILGVGNSDWASTFHRIPKLVNEHLHKLGAESIVDAAFTDAKADLIGPFDDWSDAVVAALTAKGDEVVKPSLKLHIQKAQLAKDLGDEKMSVGTVLSNKLIATADIGAAKKHLELRLPTDTTYEAGDYIVVQPQNPRELVGRVLRHFGFSAHTLVSFEGSKKKFLPSQPTSIATFLYGHVELGTPITKRQLKIISGFATGEQKSALEKLQNNAEYNDLLAKRYTIIDVLEEHPTVSLPFEAYSDMLLPLLPRQFSVSSSSLVPGQESVGSITYDVHTGPAFSGHGVFEGVASTFLASRQPGDPVSCFVRPTNVGFRVPSDPSTPILMFAAGTGIAPMRAFLQQRAVIAKAGALKLGPALLFFGCRNEEKDYIYKQELADWESQGIVRVFTAFSRPSSGEKQYVPDLIWAQRELCAELFRSDGKIFICGSAARLGKSCADVCKKIYIQNNSVGDAEAEQWLQSVKTDRYVSDVY